MESSSSSVKLRLWHLASGLELNSMNLWGSMMAREFYFFIYNGNLIIRCIFLSTFCCSVISNYIEVQAVLEPYFNLIVQKI